MPICDFKDISELCQVEGCEVVVVPQMNGEASVYL